MDDSFGLEYSKALIYCRVSSEKQVKEGNGLDSQEHRCQEDANSQGLEVEHIFRDEGISGGLFERPAIQALLKYLDDHWETKYVVIFDDLKRFARDVEVHRRLKAELRVREAKLHCLNYTFDDSAEGEFVETIFAAQNELERKQNRRQVLQKMKARIERGYWCFCPPTGYEFRKDKEHGKLMFPIYPAAKIIAEGLTAFADDRLLGQVDLLKFFTSKNLPGLLGVNKLYITSVKRILEEPLYAGIVEYPVWGISRRHGYHQAIISEEIYDRIQSKLKRTARKLWATDRCEFALRRHISCAFCGRTMTGSISRGKNPEKCYPHYTCNHKDCSANPKNIAVSRVEDDYLRLLESIAVDKELLDLAREVTMRLWKQKVKGMESSRASAEIEIQALDQEINEYIALIPKARSESLRTRYEAKAEELDQRIKDIKASLKTKKAPKFEEALELALRFLGTPAETWKNAGRELKNLIHGMIFETNPTYSLNGGFGTPSLTLPFRISQYKSTSNENMVEVARVSLASTTASTTASPCSAFLNTNEP